MLLKIVFAQNWLEYLWEWSQKFFLLQITGLIVLGKRRSSVAIDKFRVFGKKIEMDNVALQQIINRVQLLKYQYLCSFPLNFVQTFPEETLAIINFQRNNMQ